MLAPTNNTFTPGSSSDAVINSQSISSRAPQDRYYQIDDNSQSSAVVAPSPQFIDGTAVPSTYTADTSPHRTPSTVRNSHVQLAEDSPSVSHPQAYSAALSSNYIPPPSSTPSQLNACPVPEGNYNETAYPSPGGTYQQQQQYQQYRQNQYQQNQYQQQQYQQYQQNQNQQQNMFQDPYQQTYQQPYQQQQVYPEPTVHSYPEPDLVDTVDEKSKPSSAGSITKPTNNGHRKKIIWIGAIVILILIGAIIGIVVAMKNKDSDNKGGNSSDNSTSGGNSSRTSSPTPTPTTYSFGRPATSIFVTVPSTPVTVSSIPVTIPTPTGGSGSVVTPKPLPPLPPKGQCPTFFCDNWFWDCRDNVCSEDGAYKACISKCNGVFYCESDCRRNTSCQRECSDTWSTCRTHCR